MRHEIIMSGFGGQGVMVMGQLLAYAGMLENKNVSWMPAYGPEMRGGTAYCSVIIDEGSVGAPIVTKPTSAVIMNLPSLDKFESAVAVNGAVIINSSLVTKNVQREDIKSYLVPINEIANELGNIKMINMVALGALLAAAGVVEKASLMSAFAKKFASKPKMVPANEEALNKGYDYVMKLKAE
ncbi:2-oxoacid:acceptor oxidoreductase family protein [Sporomusa sp. KB1]|jgi:2-oxoglutarate ferredoxin oxidoreductase subunit gamma|uniref:2-oxoacid:acceptor oxidoreductase family protein n=1 Tax=Sporomusa sp. KB1 TaxID=943346 RepID=UPI0011A387B7|nr:2-oxoacid:acceptor oxidoreductase family protein [Sporomusa sp. KB1]TWH51969.1 2-oxoglutarate ferredoxin oxidoreductase subunit gamma [Sporomusa sp. KB1]